jgi:hypothetical protein
MYLFYIGVYFKNIAGSIPAIVSGRTFAWHHPASSIDRQCAIVRCMRVHATVPSGGKGARSILNFTAGALARYLGSPAVGN